MIYYHNPHFGPFYGTNVFSLLTRRFNHRKYWYLAEHLLRPPLDKAGIFLDLNQNSFAMFFFYKIPLLNRIITLLEFAAWLALNRINPFALKVIFSAKNLTKDDIVFVFAFDNLQGENNRLAALSSSPCVKVVHLTHYMLSTSAIARHAKSLPADFFVAESNLSRYPYFQKHFPYYTRDTYLLPFIPQPRFQRIKPFSGRTLKCVALGTLTILERTPETQDIMDFFSTDAIHPLRRAIYENRDGIGETVVSCINNYNEDARTRNIADQRTAYAKAFSAVSNIFHARQKKYFTFSAADRFNEFALFVIPEEINHLPGISWVEGMACGAAYIGLDDPMYTDLGLRPGTHYIPYDNTLKGLQDVVRYYQKNPGQLERIAIQGYEFVTRHFSGENAARQFHGDLCRLSSQATAGIDRAALRLECSFIKDQA